MVHPFNEESPIFIGILRDIVKTLGKLGWNSRVGTVDSFGIRAAIKNQAAERS
jgi:hypothetical protein